MKRIVSLFLSVFMLLCCVIPASATGLDPNTNGYTYDGLPYLSDQFYLTRDISVGSTVTLTYNPPMDTVNSYVVGVIVTNDPNPSFSSELADFTITDLGSDLFHFSCYFSNIVKDNYSIVYTKGGGSYFEFLTFNVTPRDYIRDDLTFSVNMQGLYTYRQYNDISSDQAFTNISTSFNETVSVSSGVSVYTPLLHNNTNNPNYALNEKRVFLTSFISFDWTSYDRIDLLLYNRYDELRDYVFYVDGVNVLSSITPVSISGSCYSMISLDFSDLDPNINSNTCFLRFDGYEEMSSALKKELFNIKKVSCFIRTVSDNFWPSWLTKIIDKLDNIFTGREQDQAGANSFNDSINEQADELEDLTADLNSVTRPPLSDVNLSTSGMVDQSVVVLSTNGIGSILSNQIILRVLIMSLTFALAGFILFGKR